MIISFEYSGSLTEIDIQFIQGMLDRMAVSEIKYGKIKDAYPDQINARDSMMVRLKRYLQTGNKEFLIDASNFLMIEFIHPSVKDAYFKATDSRESPGRVWHDKKFPSTKGNKE